MAGYILGGEEKNLVLRCAEVDAVIGGRNGDAALLYLALQRSSGGQDAAALAVSLGMTELRLRAAESALREMGLLGGGKPLAPARERTEFTPQEMAELLGQEDYAMLRSQVEQNHKPLIRERLAAPGFSHYPMAQLGEVHLRVTRDSPAALEPISSSFSVST